MNVQPWELDVPVVKGVDVDTTNTVDHPIPRSIYLHQPTTTTQAIGQQMQDTEITTTTATTTSSTLEQDETTTPKEDHRHPECSDSWTWNVTSEDLTPRPRFHPPLQRTALILHDIPVGTIAARISKFNKANSIECSYQTAHVQSTTPNLLKLSVYLWAGSESDSGGGGDDCSQSSGTSVIVEVQRRQGCCIQMQRVRRRLIQYVKTGYDTSHSRNNPSCFGCPSEKTESAMKNDQGCTEALSACLDLLESEKIDQNCLGMESLAIISDRSRVQLADATRVARALVYSEGCARLQDAVQGLFLHSIDETEHVGYATACYAMKTLQNSLELVLYHKEASGSGRRPKPIDLSSSFWREIIYGLVHCLEMARVCTQKAALAARCLWLIENFAPANLSLLPEYKDLPLLALDACDHGKAFHSSLERESSLLFGYLWDHD
jgi:hypothetical protein